MQGLLSATDSAAGRSGLNWKINVPSVGVLRKRRREREMFVGGYGYRRELGESVVETATWFVPSLYVGVSVRR
jgi:hypothetical protein